MGMISRKSEQPAKSPIHLRSTSQSIGAPRKEPQIMAAAGAAWTISPSELRRTIRKRSSAMRSFTKTREKLARRVALWIADNGDAHAKPRGRRSEEHTSELQSPCNLVCRLLLEKK